MIAALAGFLARSALMQSPVGAFLKAIPKQVWIALAIAFAVGAAVAVHQHVAHMAIADAKTEQTRADSADFDRQIAQAHADALAWRNRAIEESQQITKLEKDKADAETRAHAAAADALLVRGPGAAASHCGPGYPAAVSGGAGGHDQAAPAGAAARPQVPPGDWATVPWSWLVGVVREHDDLRSEDLTWRDDHARQAATWERLRSAAIPDRPKP